MNTSQRIRFLERHGFIHDPFETPVAEQELGRYRQVFYSYYTPFYSITHTNILQTLRQPQHACVYGAPGQGKSTLRLTLEAECRAVFDGTLTVTYLLGEEIPRPLTLQEHGERLTRALVTDLTLGILEQFNPLYPPPTSAQVEALKMLLPAAGHTLERWIAILTSDLPEVDPHWGIGHYWTILGRAPVKYVENSSALQSLLQQLNKPVERKKIDDIHNWNVFWQGVDVAHAWGFRPIFVLVDGVDSQERDLDFMQALLYPLFEQLATVQSKNLFFKFFLPSELKEVAEKAIKDLYPHPVFSIMIEWDDPSLSSLLTQRLRTAAPSRRYPGLDSLAKPGLDLEQKVIQAAKGSPRRLLRLVSALIDAHILHQPDALLFDQVDWEIALHSFQKGHP